MDEDVTIPIPVVRLFPDAGERRPLNARPPTRDRPAPSNEAQRRRRPDETTRRLNRR